MGVPDVNQVKNLWIGVIHLFKIGKGFAGSGSIPGSQIHRRRQDHIPLVFRMRPIRHKLQRSRVTYWVKLAAPLRRVIDLIEGNHIALTCRPLKLIEERE